MPRRYCWTLNNYTATEVEDIMLLCDSNDYIRGLGFGYEVGENGTPHLQGVIALQRNCRITQVRSWDGLQRAHFEPMSGTWEQAEEYCQKEGHYQFWGERPTQRQGRRTDLIELQQALDDGDSLRDISRAHFGQWMRYERSIRSYRNMDILGRRVDPEYSLESFPWEEPDEVKSLILWGSAGIGKTEFAKALLPRCLFVSHMDDLRSFDPSDYDGIVFDDMNFSHLPRSGQIHLLDWDNPRSIHVRYGVASIPRHTRKIFTTNVAGGAIFDLSDSAISRRCDIIHLEGNPL